MKSRLVIAAAVLVGTATVALAQSARHDYSDDRTLSYGPQQPAATRTANPAQAPIGRDQHNRFDPTDDKSVSYGAPN
jgi:hypothetical protein